jgi:hypothetical protein
VERQEVNSLGFAHGKNIMNRHSLIKAEPSQANEEEEEEEVRSKGAAARERS